MTKIKRLYKRMKKGIKIKHPESHRFFWFVVRAALAFLFTLFVFAIAHIIVCFFLYHSLFPKSDVIIKNDNIFSTLVEICFTIFGFAVTFRGFLISAHLSNYNGFSMKVLIDNGTDWICKFTWYIILFSPFWSLLLYGLGYRMPLYILATLSGVCAGIYFLTVIWRLGKDNCRETIEYMLLENLMCENSHYIKEYRKELIQKILIDEKNRTEAQIIYYDSLNILYGIIINNIKTLVLKHRRPLRNVIQTLVINNWTEKDNKQKIMVMKRISSLSYLFFYHSIDKCDESEYYNLIIQFIGFLESFVKNKNIILFNNNVLVEDLDNDVTYNKTLLISVLYYNLLFGLLCACTSKMKMKEIENIIESIIELSLDYETILSEGRIKVLAIYALYYAKENDLLHKSISPKAFYTTVVKLFKETDVFDYDFFKRNIDEDFTAFEYSKYLKEIFSIVNSEIKKFYY